MFFCPEINKQNSCIGCHSLSLAFARAHLFHASTATSFTTAHARPAATGCNLNLHNDAPPTCTCPHTRITRHHAHQRWCGRNYLHVRLLEYAVPRPAKARPRVRQHLQRSVGGARRSNVARHHSHVTRHMSHVTCHTSHATAEAHLHPAQVARGLHEGKTDETQDHTTTAPPPPTLKSLTSLAPHITLAAAILCARAD